MDILRNRLWREMKQAKTYCSCLEHYTNKARKNNRHAEILIIILSLLPPSFYYYDTFISLIASFIVILGTVVKAILPKFKQPEEDLVELDKLLSYYGGYMANLEFLWIQMENKYKDDKILLDEFVKLKQTEVDKLPVLNRLVRSLSKEDNDIFTKETEEYLIENFYGQQPET